MTSGQHQQDSLAGALALATEMLLHGRGARTTTQRCRDLLETLEALDPAERYTRLSGVVDHDQLHQAKAGETWLATHPRVTLVLWPTDGPRANPSERAVGDVHAGGPRT